LNFTEIGPLVWALLIMERSTDLQTDR